MEELGNSSLNMGMSCKPPTKPPTYDAFPHLDTRTFDFPQTAKEELNTKKQ